MRLCSLESPENPYFKLEQAYSYRHAPCYCAIFGVFTLAISDGRWFVLGEFSSAYLYDFPGFFLFLCLLDLFFCLYSHSRYIGSVFFLSSTA